MIERVVQLASVLAYFPPPPVHNVRVGSLTFHLYGLILGIAVLAAVWIIDITARRSSIPEGTVGAVALPSVVMGFVGARIYHLISQPEFYWHHPVDALEIWHGGLGIWGGVLFGALTGVLIARRRGVRALPLLDAAAPGIVIAQAIGRWGNYVNQELFGRPTHLPWALRVSPSAVQTAFATSPHLLATYGTDTLFQPTFLYESLWDLALGLLLLALLYRWQARRAGMLFALYVGFYSLGRLGTESLRIDEAHTFAGLRQNQWLAIALIVVGIVWAAVLEWRGGRPRGPVERPALR